MKALVGAFNQEKALVEALVEAFSMIVKTDGSFAALLGPGPVNCGADGEI